MEDGKETVLDIMMFPGLMPPRAEEEEAVELVSSD